MPKIRSKESQLAYLRTKITSLEQLNDDTIKAKVEEYERQLRLKMSAKREAKLLDLRAQYAQVLQELSA